MSLHLHPLPSPTSRWSSLFLCPRHLHVGPSAFVPSQCTPPRPTCTAPRDPTCAGTRVPSFTLSHPLLPDTPLHSHGRVHKPLPPVHVPVYTQTRPVCLTTPHTDTNTQGLHPYQGNDGEPPNQGQSLKGHSRALPRTQGQQFSGARTLRREQSVEVGTTPFHGCRP